MVEGTCEDPQPFCGPCRPQMYKVPCADSKGGQKAQKQKGGLGRESNFPVAELIIGNKLSMQPPPKESRIPTVRLNTLVDS